MSRISQDDQSCNETNSESFDPQAPPPLSPLGYASFPPNATPQSRPTSRKGYHDANEANDVMSGSQSQDESDAATLNDLRIDIQPLRGPDASIRSSFSAAATTAAAVAALKSSSASVSVREQLWRVFHPTTIKPISLRSNLYVAEREGTILSRGMILKSDHFPEPSLASPDEVVETISTALARHASEYNEKLRVYEKLVTEYAEQVFRYKKNKASMKPPVPPAEPSYPQWPGFDVSLSESHIAGILSEESNRLALAATGGVIPRSQRIVPALTKNSEASLASQKESGKYEAGVEGEVGEVDGEVDGEEAEGESSAKDNIEIDIAIEPSLDTVISPTPHSTSPATKQDVNLPSKILAPNWRSPLDSIFSYYQSLPRASIQFLPLSATPLLKLSQSSMANEKAPIVSGFPKSGALKTDKPSEIGLIRTPSMNAIARAAAAAKVADMLGESFSSQEDLVVASTPKTENDSPIDLNERLLNALYQELPILPVNKGAPSVSIPTWTAPNFRQTQGFSAAAVAQPSVSGIRAILNMLLTSQYQQQLNARTPQQQQLLQQQQQLPQSSPRLTMQFFASMPSHTNFPSIKIQWLNLREEAVVYIANRPFVLRDSTRPTKNLRDFDGITGKRLKVVERQLKADILNEAKYHGGNILIHDEATLGDVLPYWTSSGLFSESRIGVEVAEAKGLSTALTTTQTSVQSNYASFASTAPSNADSNAGSIASPHKKSTFASALVQTPEEIFKVLSELENYSVTLHRVPLAANSALRPRDFDALLHAFLSSQRDRGPNDQIMYVFNCQMGKGRSTVGMVCLMLLQSCLIGFPNAIWPHPASTGTMPPPWLGYTPGPTERRKLHKMLLQDDAAKSRKISSQESLLKCVSNHSASFVPNPMLVPKAHKQGPPRSTTFPMPPFVAVQNLLRLMIHTDGVAVQREVDHVMNVCGAAINLKLDLLHHVKLFESSNPADADIARERSISRMRRYLSLLCFHYYLKTMQRQAIRACGLELFSHRAKTVSAAFDMLSRFVPVFFELIDLNPFSRWIKNEAGIEAAVWGDEMALQDRVVANAASAAVIAAATAAEGVLEPLSNTPKSVTARTSWFPVTVLRNERSVVLETVPDITDLSKLSPCEVAVFNRHRPVLGSQVILKADILPHLGLGGDPLCLDDLSVPSTLRADEKNLKTDESPSMKAATSANILDQNSDVTIAVTKNEVMGRRSRQAARLAADPALLAYAVKLYSLGIPGFRTLKEAPFAALAQPSCKGIQFILDSIRKLAAVGARSPNTIWINLRDEPVVYIRGIPYIPRRVEHPLQSLTNRHDDPSALEALEMNLKYDILSELAEMEMKQVDVNADDIALRMNISQSTDANLWVHEEIRGRKIRAVQLKSIDPSDVETPRELFERLRKDEKFPVKYHRIPLLSEHAPSAGALDLFMQILDGPLGGTLCERYPDYEQERLERGRRLAEEALIKFSPHSNRKALTQIDGNVENNALTVHGDDSNATSRKAYDIDRISPTELIQRRKRTASLSILPGIGPEGDWDGREEWEPPIPSIPAQEDELEDYDENIGMETPVATCTIEQDPSMGISGGELGVVCRPTRKSLEDAAQIERELADEENAALAKVMAEVFEAASHVKQQRQQKKKAALGIDSAAFSSPVAQPNSFIEARIRKSAAQHHAPHHHNQQAWMDANQAELFTRNVETDNTSKENENNFDGIFAAFGEGRGDEILTEDNIDALRVADLLLPNVIMNCMKGSRRSTVALVVALLILVHNRQITIRSATFTKQAKPSLRHDKSEDKDASSKPKRLVELQDDNFAKPKNDAANPVVILQQDIEKSDAAIRSPGIRRVGSYLSLKQKQQESSLKSMTKNVQSDDDDFADDDDFDENGDYDEEEEEEEEEGGKVIDDFHIKSADLTGIREPKQRKDDQVKEPDASVGSIEESIIHLSTEGAVGGKNPANEESLVWSFKDSSPYIGYRTRRLSVKSDEDNSLDDLSLPVVEPDKSPSNVLLTSQMQRTPSPSVSISPSAETSSFKFLTPARNSRTTSMRAVALAVAAAMGFKDDSSESDIVESQQNKSEVTAETTLKEDSDVLTADPNLVLSKQLSKVFRNSIGSPRLKDVVIDSPKDKVPDDQLFTDEGADIKDGKENENSSTTDAAAAAMVAATAIAVEREQIDHMVRTVTSADAEALAREQQRRGMHTAIIKLTRLLRQGRTVKEETDVVIDVCGAVCNLRDEILDAMNYEDGETRSESVASASAARAGALLYSYALLICFNAYLRERSYSRNRHAITHRQKLAFARAEHKRNHPENEAFVSNVAPKFEYPAFSQWLDRRTEVLGLLESILKNPEEALVIDPNFMHDKHAPVYEGRKGHVLGPGTILKSDAFANIANKDLRQICEGVINFRIVQRFPVAGTGIPTIPGLVQLLSILTGLEHPLIEVVSPVQNRPGTLINASEEESATEPVSAPPYQYSHIVWFNLREEPVLYVDGRPFVLRDFRQPYANVENTGISSQRTEAMEKQLKRDVLAESRRRSNTLLLHDETSDGNLCSKEISIHVSRQQLQLMHNQPAYRIAPFTSNSLPLIEAKKVQESTELVVASSSKQALVNSIPGLELDENGWPLPGSVLTMGEAFRFSIDVVLKRHRQLAKMEEEFRKEMLAARGKFDADANAPSPTSESDRCHISYFRTPITDEQAPRPEIVDSIVRSLEEAHKRLYQNCPSDDNTVHNNSKLLIIMNCQMGRGRTTTGMIMASVWCHVRRIYRKSVLDYSEEETIVAPKLLEASQNLPGIHDDSKLITHEPHSGKPEHSAKQSAQTAGIERRKQLLKQGWYSAVSSLLRVLPRGADAKRLTDIMADRCAKMQNLREVVFEMQEMASNSLPGKQKSILHKGKNFLIRYLTLITITSYLLTQAPKDFTISFAQWLHARAEVRRLFEPSSVKYPEPLLPSTKSSGGSAHVSDDEGLQERFEWNSEDEDFYV